jgi:hypothetical protein
MNRYKEFEQKIKRSLNQMDAKIGYLHEGVKGLQDSFSEFREDITEYMSFTQKVRAITKREFLIWRKR